MADTTISQLNTISTLSANNFIPISDGTTTTKLGTESLFGFRNRIINGDMRIDQRNNGAAVTITNINYPWTYSVDRWSVFNYQPSKLSVQRNMDSIAPPSGFTNYVGIKTVSPYSIGVNESFGIHQRIEGNNCYDLGWGTNNAKTITLSFWVRSSKTGIFAGYLDNYFDNRWFTFTYNIISANTWEYKTITIPGDVTGNWRTDNLAGVLVGFYVGAGTGFSSSINTWGSNQSYPIGGANILDTLNAAFYITGVQFELGSTATPFERRFIGTELALCQRYYNRITRTANDASLTQSFFDAAFWTGPVANDGYCHSTYRFPVLMSSESITADFSNASTFWYHIGGVAQGVITAVGGNVLGVDAFKFGLRMSYNGGNGFSGQILARNGYTAYLGFSAEL